MMSLILGMDIFVFIAWIGTILAAAACVLYGIYYKFFKRLDGASKSKKTPDKNTAA